MKLIHLAGLLALLVAVRTVNAMQDYAAVEEALRELERNFETQEELKDLPLSPDDPKCKPETKVDITFVLDGSSSIGYGNYNWRLKDAVKGIINYMLPGPGDVPANSRVAAIVYSKTSVLHWNLDKYQTKNELLKAVSALPYPASKTATGDALHDALTLVHPKVRPGVKHLVILITDGDSNAGTYVDTEEAQKLKDAGAKLFVVGVGAELKKDVLDKMASGPEYRADVTSYNDLLTKMKDLAALTCKEAVETTTVAPTEPSTPSTPTAPPTSPPTAPPCTEDTKVDITFVLDSSYSIGADNYEKGLKTAVKGIINYMLPGAGDTPSNSRVAAILFSDKSVLQWNLDTYKTKNELLKAVEGLPYYSSLTATGDGLHDALTQVHPKVRPGVKHLVILITDGESNWGTYTDTEEAQKLKDAGAIVFVIGVGKELNKDVLDKMASGPEYRADVSSYNDLVAKMKKLAILTCKEAVAA